MGIKKDQHKNEKNQDVSKIQSQKTTEYNREPNQKQAKGAQVIEISVYQGKTKQNDRRFEWAIDYAFLRENKTKIMLNTVTLKANCGSECTSKNQACLYTERTNLLQQNC